MKASAGGLKSLDEFISEIAHLPEAEPKGLNRDSAILAACPHAMQVLQPLGGREKAFLLGTTRKPRSAHPSVHLRERHSSFKVNVQGGIVSMDWEETDEVAIDDTEEWDTRPDVIGHFDDQGNFITDCAPEKLEEPQADASDESDSDWIIVKNGKTQKRRRQAQKEEVKSIQEPPLPKPINESKHKDIDSKPHGDSPENANVQDSSFPSKSSLIDDDGFTLVKDKKKPGAKRH